MENKTLEIKPCRECEFRKIMLLEDPLPIRCIRRDILDYRRGSFSFPKLVYYVLIYLWKLRRTSIPDGNKFVQQDKEKE